MIIGIQGVAFSYHHQAALEYFGDGADICYLSSFAELFYDLLEGTIDVAVCAVENSIYGGIADVYDLLAAHQTIWIGGEVLLGINHCLAALPEANKRDITDIYSHPVALGQCRAYLKKNFPNARLHEWQDTAAAAEKVLTDNNKTAAAICSEPAAIHNQLIVLDDAIADNATNATRFVVLHAKRQPAPGANKTSLMLELPHQAGALYDTLGVLKLAGLNMSMLISRPLPASPFQYRFYIDIEAGIDESATKLALDHLASQNIPLRVLGSYTKAK